MGTPAAPDLANVTLAEIEASRVSNMELLLLFVRYIDDIFAVYAGTREDTQSPIQPMYDSLNLKLTIETSYSQMDMLDLAIFKGPRFLSSGILDIRTHQKTMNKYLYLPSRSAHPLYSKTGFIKAELKRYVMRQ
ncbi:unnamed protein product, partial [Discosporangium mesarthrocarpum]